MNNRLEELLDFLEATLDPERQAAAEALFSRSLSYQPVGRPPLVVRHPLPEDFRFQPYPHREVFDDPAKMLFNEMVYAFGSSIACRSRLNDDLPLTVRANFGTVIIASLYGARVEQRDDDPPWIRRDEDHPVHPRAILDHDPADTSRGWGPRVLRTMQFYRKVLAERPKLRDLIRIVLPDMQGPLDNLELICGSAVFAALHTDSEAVARALAHLAEAQIAFDSEARRWTSDRADAFCHQHAVMLKGNILIRNDSAILISPDMYRDLVAPHDARVLEALGGGGIHSCGRIDSHAAAFLNVPHVTSIDLGQPELNDVDAIYARARESRIPLIRVTAGGDELRNGTVRRRFPTGVVLVHQAQSLNAANEIAKAYKE